MCIYVSDSAKVGEDLFRDVLRCKGRADQTRSALTVLQRYRFLFNLPHTIEKNITNVREGRGSGGEREERVGEWSKVRESKQEVKFTIIVYIAMYMYMLEHVLLTG